jgi:SOS-response transcriptional repressor LexA
MTPRQKQCFDYVRDYISDHDGESPSYDMIRSALGLRSKSGVFRIVDVLIFQGRLFKSASKSARALSLTPYVQPKPVGAIASFKTSELLIELYRRDFNFNGERRAAR